VVDSGPDAVWKRVEPLPPLHLPTAHKPNHPLTPGPIEFTVLP